MLGLTPTSVLARYRPIQAYRVVAGATPARVRDMLQ
jgi:hypothetical protein